ncbi:Protein trichome birefringence-like [Quillaja saponaria]|uniref:Protein trichome birefringence-like n=1 Tax=Quillaja saponaria TaxID=32244 RepID=A0AAD7P9L9_QUISA|nr:Protein trichome birefringence-like [Quillaja saponaria]
MNKEARRLNLLIEVALQGTEIQLLDLTHLSEFCADAHPAIWLGKKDAVAIWGEDCMHWCMPRVPDTWVDNFSELIRNSLERGGVPRYENLIDEGKTHITVTTLM